MCYSITLLIGSARLVQEYTFIKYKTFTFHANFLYLVLCPQYMVKYNCLVAKKRLSIYEKPTLSFEIF